jgi:6-phosphogluconate dehydrogenase (decarboxylating)
MQLGMIGLGRMGANMVRRVLKGGHQCVVFDKSSKVVKEMAEENAIGASSEYSNFLSGQCISTSCAGRTNSMKPCPSRRQN